MGWPLPFNDSVRVVDAKTQREVPRGESGLIQVNTKSRAIGFIEQPAKYWGRRHGKWFDTGDIGRAARWGTLELLDREVDRIEGVESCIWIEDVLFDRLPELREVVIVADDEGRPGPIVCTREDKRARARQRERRAANRKRQGAPVRDRPSDDRERGGGDPPPRRRLATADTLNSPAVISGPAVATRRYRGGFR